ncbi:hypothetical protein QFW96_02970 [Saccharopolyspora sp. TS4A08]|uniref:WXG100 family type VII secretion target n=1 Tax=Saccharopolyspora ipomoeae TaxID=3042027 RepID=A0ABT6PHT4_9PSEU|nr:hypothetical protein [Saccharopolyspora sp. TS4A08]MDI2027553.1 hypothetical protein [Saccharopolyspora sp. TS4A08]
MPENADLSGPSSDWTFFQALNALTGKGPDLKSKAEGIKWFEVAGGGDGGAGGKDADFTGDKLKEDLTNRVAPTEDLTYTAFDRVYYRVNRNTAATDAWTQAINDAGTIVEEMSSGKSGTLDLPTLRQAQDLVGKYEKWLEGTGTDFRAWAKSLDSEDSGFSGKAASVIQGRMDQNADKLEGLHEQLTIDRGVAVSVALKNLGDKMEAAIKGLAEAFYDFRSRALYAPNNKRVDYENQLYDFLTNGVGLVKGAPNYQLDGKSTSEAQEYINTSLASFKEGNLVTAGPWDKMNTEISNAALTELKTLDTAAAAALKPLEEELKYTQSAIKELTEPEASAPNTPPTTPPPNGDTNIPPPPGGDTNIPPPPGGDTNVPPPGGDTNVPPPGGGDGLGGAGGGPEGLGGGDGLGGDSANGGVGGLGGGDGLGGAGGGLGGADGLGGDSANGGLGGLGSGDGLGGAGGGLGGDSGLGTGDNGANGGATPPLVGPGGLGLGGATGGAGTKPGANANGDPANGGAGGFGDFGQNDPANGGVGGLSGDQQPGLVDSGLTQSSFDPANGGASGFGDVPGQQDQDRPGGMAGVPLDSNGNPIPGAGEGIGDLANGGAGGFGDTGLPGGADSGLGAGQGLGDPANGGIGGLGAGGNDGLGAGAGLGDPANGGAGGFGDLPGGADGGLGAGAGLGDPANGGAGGFGDLPGGQGGFDPGGLGSGAGEGLGDPANGGLGGFDPGGLGSDSGAGLGSGAGIGDVANGGAGGFGDGAGGLGSGGFEGVSDPADGYGFDNVSDGFGAPDGSADGAGGSGTGSEQQRGGAGGGTTGFGMGSGAGSGLGGSQASPLPPGMSQLNGPSTQQGMGGMPFMPPMMGGMGGQQGDKSERERQTWLSEDEDVWGTNADAGMGVIGLPDEADFDVDEQIAAGPVRPPRQPQQTPAEQEQTTQATAQG